MLLFACIGLFGILTSAMIYNIWDYKRDHYRIGSVPIELINQLVPKDISLESLRPPALRVEDPIRFGNATSLLSVIEYGDYQCEHCQKVAPELKKAVAQFKGDVRFVWRDFPLQEVNQDALEAAIFARCAGQQGKFWETHDLLLANSGLNEKFYRSIISKLNLNAKSITVCRNSPAIKDAILKDVDEGKADGIKGIPLIFIGTKAFNGYLDAAAIVKEIKAELSS